MVITIKLTVTQDCPSLAQPGRLPRSGAASSTAIAQLACSRVGWDDRGIQCTAPSRWASTKLTIHREPTTGVSQSPTARDQTCEGFSGRYFAALPAAAEEEEAAAQAAAAAILRHHR